MNYCSHCGAPVALKIPPGDLLPRHVCGACETIHYQNPTIVVGCLPEWDGRLLLCRRAIEPRAGRWTYPAGFMETGETIEEAAVRETWEEAQARVELVSLYGVFSLPHVSQVYVVFRGRLLAPEFGAGSESLDAQLIPPEKIPWDELAFPVIHETLVRYVRDQGQGRFEVQLGLIPPAHC